MSEPVERRTERGQRPEARGEGDPEGCFPEGLGGQAAGAENTREEGQEAGGFQRVGVWGMRKK